MTNSTERKQGSGKLTTACPEENMTITEELIASHVNQPGTHLSQGKIANRLNISRRSVNRTKIFLNWMLLREYKYQGKIQTLNIGENKM